MLDVGTGLGTVLDGFASARVRVGVDIDERALRRAAARSAESRPEPLFAVGDAERLPFADRFFDAVIMYDVLEHVNSLDVAVSEASRVLRAGGAVLVTAANPWSPISVLDDPHSHMPLVSVLPPRISRWIVEDLRHHREDHPGIHPRLPSWGALHRAFGRSGVRLELVTNLVLLEEPSFIVDPSHRRIAGSLRRLGVLRALRSRLGRPALALYDRALARSWTFVGVKRG